MPIQYTTYNNIISRSSSSSSKIQDYYICGKNRKWIL